MTVTDRSERNPITAAPQLDDMVERGKVTMASVLCGVWSSIDLDTARLPMPWWSVSLMMALSGSVAPDPGSALALAFADREPADDAHSSFVQHTHELT